MDRRQWIATLRRTAEPAAATDAPLGLASLETPFRRAVRGLDAPDAEPADERDDDIATTLWSAVSDEAIAPDDGLVRGDASLVEQGRFRTIEVWTETELCALHALAKLARRRGRADLAHRAVRAARWHLERTQPDNATNRPWAIHVFVELQTPEAEHYAGTLLHNAIVSSGRPDVLSAWILLDAADELEAAPT